MRRWIHSLMRCFFGFEWRYFLWRNVSRSKSSIRVRKKRSASFFSPEGSGHALLTHEEEEWRRHRHELLVLGEDLEVEV